MITKQGYLAKTNSDNILICSTNEVTLNYRMDFGRPLVCRQGKGMPLMSRLSFKTFCIEYYAGHTGRPSVEVYDLFSRAGLLELLDSDYEDLHGMSMEYLMQFFDEYLKGGAA